MVFLFESLVPWSSVCFAMAGGATAFSFSPPPLFSGKSFAKGTPVLLEPVAAWVYKEEEGKQRARDEGRAPEGKGRPEKKNETAVDEDARQPGASGGCMGWNNKGGVVVLDVNLRSDYYL